MEIHSYVDTVHLRRRCQCRFLALFILRVFLYPAMMVACFMATPVAAMVALSLDDDDNLLDPSLLEVNNWHIVDPHQEKMKAQQSKFMENINSTAESGLNDSSDAEERISDVAPAVSREVGLFKWRVLKQIHSH